jgi:plastocyanin
MDRRHYLAALVTAPLVSVAGCSDDAETETEADAGTVTDTATATDATTATATDTSTAAATDTSTATATETGGTETATDTSTTTDTATTATDTPTPTATSTPSMSQTVQVAPESLRFSPKSFEIAVGTTVEWVWEADGHNIVVDSQPAGSEWSGTPGDDLYGEGYTHEYTFEVPGSYEYYCGPHQSFAMVGSFTVVE